MPPMYGNQNRLQEHSLHSFIQLPPEIPSIVYWKLHTKSSTRLVSKLMLWAQSTKKDYIRAENKRQSIPYYPVRKSLNHKSHFLKPKLSVEYFAKTLTQRTLYFIQHISLSRKVKMISTIWKCQPRQTILRVGGPVYIPWTLNMGTCNESKVTYFILRTNTGTGVSHTNCVKCL